MGEEGPEYVRPELDNKMFRPPGEASPEDMTGEREEGTAKADEAGIGSVECGMPVTSHGPGERAGGIEDHDTWGREPGDK